MSNTKIGDAGLKTLQSVPALRWVNLRGSKITAAGFLDFVQNRPDCIVDVRGLPFLEETIDKAKSISTIPDLIKH